MTLPPFVYAKAFWQAISLLIAGALALLVFFGVLGQNWLYGAVAIYAFIESVLKFFGITPELRLRGFRGWFKRG